MSFTNPTSKSVWLLLIASLAFNAGVGATFGVLTYTRYASPDWHGRPERGPHSRGWLHQLNLTPEQVDQMKAGEGNMRKRIDELHRTLREEHEALAELMAAPEPDRDAVQIQLATVASLRGQVQREVVDHFLDIKDSLDPAQREAFNETIRRVLHHGGLGRPGFGKPHGPRGEGERQGHWNRPPRPGDGE